MIRLSRAAVPRLTGPPRSMWPRPPRRPMGSSPSDPGGGGWRERIASLRSNGTPEIALGGSVLLLLAADQFLQGRSEEKFRRDKAAVMTRLRHDVRIDLEREAAGGMDGAALAAVGGTGGGSDLAQIPALFRCRVVVVPRYFDGTKSLKGTVVGDILDVLEEGVGPGRAYNLCRRTTRGGGGGGEREGQGEEDGEEGSASLISVGWYPMTCLEKLNE